MDLISHREREKEREREIESNMDRCGDNVTTRQSPGGEKSKERIKCRHVKGLRFKNQSVRSGLKGFLDARILYLILSLRHTTE